jgi:hypothetical protein
MGGVCERFDAAKIDEDRANPAKGGDKHYERKKHLAWPREIQRQFLEGNNKVPKARKRARASRISDGSPLRLSSRRHSSAQMV